MSNFLHKDIDYVMFVDENNCEDTTNIKKKIFRGKYGIRRI